jgi:hypothetical protein
LGAVNAVGLAAGRDDVGVEGHPADEAWKNMNDPETGTVFPNM